MPCMQGMQSGKSDILGMVRPVPCGQIILGKTQPAHPLDMPGAHCKREDRRSSHLVFAFYTLSAAPPSIGITASGWPPQGQEQGHGHGREAKVVTNHLPMKPGPWDINVAHTWGWR